MAKDKGYEEHLKAMERDRPKDFPVFEVHTTDDYIKAWCLRNNLVNDATGLILVDAKSRKRRKRKKP